MRASPRLAPRPPHVRRRRSSPICAREGKDLWLVGGGALIAAFMEARLIDDVIVSIHPVLLGDGIPLVARGVPRMPLALVGERRFPSGLVQLSYRAER
jgi:dihydrofolate reductase